MNEIPPCPKCQSAYVYEDGGLLVCPECAHEWAKVSDTATSDVKTIRDARVFPVYIEPETPA